MRLDQFLSTASALARVVPGFCPTDEALLDWLKDNVEAIAEVFVGYEAAKKRFKELARDDAYRGIVLALAKKPWEQAHWMALHDRCQELGAGDVWERFEAWCRNTAIGESSYPRAKGRIRVGLKMFPTHRGWLLTKSWSRRHVVRELLATWATVLENHFGVDAVEIPF